MRQSKIEFQPIPVLNTGHLSFTQSDTPIFLSYSAEEFLTYSRLAPDKPPLAEFVAKIRESDQTLHAKILSICADKWTDLQKYTDEKADFISAKLHVRANTLQFDDIVIDASDEVLAMLVAFLADAALGEIKAGDSVIPIFSISLRIQPPYAF